MAKQVRRPRDDARRHAVAVPGRPSSASHPKADRRASSELGESVERLVESGLRLNGQPTEAALHETLIEEVAELLGARRALLVLEDAGGRRVAGAQLPDGEDAAALLAAIGPWVDEARTLRSSRLRHGPDGADPIDQRSCMVAPLLVNRELLGVLYADLEGLFGRFRESDHHLLATLAAQAAVALANLRTQEGLERQVAERTAALEQRAGELALINSIQQGMSAKLDFQGIVNLVGDKLREVFGSEDLSIRWWDPEADTTEALYLMEHGQHVPKLGPRPIGKLPRRILNEGIGAVYGTRDEQRAVGLGAAPGTDWCHSIIAAPIRGTQRVLGMIVIENHEREHAYVDADLRVLTTIGATMGAALENARLFDETQRLLKETEQRNAELAVINSVQQGISSKLDFQGIVDLVGDKLREVFASGDIGIAWWDPEGERLLPAYIYEHGARLTIPARKVLRGSFPDRFIRERRTFVFGCYADQDAAGVRTIEGTDRARSIVMVPMVSGERFLGVVQLEDHLHDHAFGEAQVRLLETIAAGMGVALQNALLLEETQRRARESSALSDVGRDLSATLDLATVLDRIARHAKELLGAGSSAIFLPDEGGSTHRAIVAVGDAADEIKATVIAAGTGIIGSLLQSGQSELINDTAADPRAVQIAGTQRRASERLMVVPLLTGEQVQGAMAVWRVGGEPFQARELEFLIGLSRQAAIALHNARLFDETRASLEQQTATAEVLRVISSSPTDVQPVFDKIVTLARDLAGSAVALVTRYEAGLLRFVAGAGLPPGRGALLADSFSGPPDRSTAAGRAVLARETVCIEDTAADPEYVRHGVDAPHRRVFAVPLLREGEPIGTINLGWVNAGPIPDKVSRMLRTFADQAVIAIENVRLFNETKEALERQTRYGPHPLRDERVRDRRATGIRRHRGSCRALFEDSVVALRLLRDGVLHVEANIGMDSGPVPLDSSSAVGICVLEARTIWVTDLETATARFRHAKHGAESGIPFGDLRAFARGGSGHGHDRGSEEAGRLQ